jgi:hypothetical protein
MCIAVEATPITSVIALTLCPHTHQSTIMVGSGSRLGNDGYTVSVMARSANQSVTRRAAMHALTNQLSSYPAGRGRKKAPLVS